MVKFGGPGKSKQKCKERKCHNMQEPEQVGTNKTENSFETKIIFCYSSLNSKYLLRALFLHIKILGTNLQDIYI